MRVPPLVVVVASLLSCVCSRSGGNGTWSDSRDDKALSAAKSFELDETKALADLNQIASSPHPAGSARQAEVLAWLTTRATESGTTPIKETFKATVPNPQATAGSSGPVAETSSLDAANLHAFGSVKPDAPCVVAVGSHYDTKVVAGVDYLGANDSGSSSVLLLHLAAYLKAHATELDATCDIAFVWFDAEEAVLPGWNDGRQHPAGIDDHTYGSAHAAGRLTACTFEGKAVKCLPADLGGKPLIALVLLDMVGSPDILINRETNSTKALMDLARTGAEALDLKRHMSDTYAAVEDDHIPYLRAGVPAVDLIDFRHLDYWHKQGDDVSTLSLESIEIAGKIALYTAVTIARSPQVFAP